MKNFIEVEITFKAFLAIQANRSINTVFLCQKFQFALNKALEEEAKNCNIAVTDCQTSLSQGPTP